MPPGKGQAVRLVNVERNALFLFTCPTCMYITFLAFFCQYSTHLHLGQKTSNWIRIKAPDVALYRSDLRFMREARTTSRNQQTRRNSSQKIPTTAGGIEDADT